jgi:hypothetical protein
MAIAASLPEVISPAPMVAAQVRALIGSTPENSPEQAERGVVEDEAADGDDRAEV